MLTIMDRIKKITPSTIQVCLFSITAEVFTSMVWLNCPLPEIVDRRDMRQVVSELIALLSNKPTPSV